MYDNSAFQQLVSNGLPTGEVVGVERYLVSVRGLDGVAIGALIMFESGKRGMVREVGEDVVLVLNLETEATKLGEFVVLANNTFTTDVGDALIGRIITPLCQPLDTKGPIRLEATWPIYNKAPGIHERNLLNDQLPSGVIIVDTLFPIVLGQRIAILGDTKSGKSSFLLQLGINQTNLDRIVVYVLIGKRRIEIEQTIRVLNESGAINSSIVVIANIFDSLAQSYIAPYVGCSIAEYLWHNGRDVVIIYDDLSSHAKVYREVSLLSQTSPGRDSYPGDMFFAHSSLLERAGKLSENGKTLTALPTVVTPGDDITAYLPTSIMSITDGQIIFDLNTFRQNIRPAVNTGLSVSRVGGRAQTPRQKVISSTLFKKLADYRQAAEFAHFGSDMTPETKLSLEFGRLIHDAFHQTSSELFSLIEQQLILETILVSGGQHKINISLLKKQARDLAPSIQQDTDIDALARQLLQVVTMGAAPA